MGIQGRAVIYVRISEDREGEGVAVERQERECRELAASLNLTVTRVYADNSVSATKAKRRPGFEALLAATPPAILVWHQDRLLRKTEDLERVIRLDVPVHSVAGGSLDLATPQGRAVARTVAAWSTYETEQKALRQKAENRQRVGAGYAVAGRVRWGFLDAQGTKRAGNVFEHPVQGPQVREAYQRFADGDSIVQLAADYGFTRVQMRRILSSRAYIGEVEYKGQWFPAHRDVARIVPVDLFNAVQARLTDPSRKPKAGNQVQHLASGLARCGVDGCEGHMRFKSGNYICDRSFAHTAIKASMLDEHLCWEVFAHLASEPESVGGDLPAIEAQLAELEEERADLSVSLTVRGVKKAPLVARLGQIEDEVTALTERKLLLLSEHIAAQVVAELREALLSEKSDQEGADWWEARWASLGLHKQRELVRGLDVVVNPGRGIDRVSVSPKL